MTEAKGSISEEDWKRRERYKTLEGIFPNDQKLCNAILMGQGVCQQLPLLASTLERELLDCYKLKPNETTEREDKLMQACADTLAWATQLEIMLHDLRAALFFRFNNRIKAKEPSEEEQKRDEARAAAARQIAEQKSAPDASAPKPEVPYVEQQAKTADKLDSLFAELK